MQLPNISAKIGAHLGQRNVADEKSYRGIQFSVRLLCRNYDADTRSPVACSPCARDATRSSRRWTPRLSASVPVDTSAHGGIRIPGPRRRDPTPAPWRSRLTAATACCITATTKLLTTSEKSRVRNAQRQVLVVTMNPGRLPNQPRQQRTAHTAFTVRPRKKKNDWFSRPTGEFCLPSATIGHLVPADCRNVAVRSRRRIPVRGDLSLGRPFSARRVHPVAFPNNFFEFYFIFLILSVFLFVSKRVIDASSWYAL